MAAYAATIRMFGDRVAHDASAATGAVPGSGTWIRRTVSEIDADCNLVQRCLKGEEAAWEDMVRAHTRRVYSVCYRFTNSDSEAQDLTQDVFLRVFKSLG